MCLLSEQPKMHLCGLQWQFQLFSILPKAKAADVSMQLPHELTGNRREWRLQCIYMKLRKGSLFLNDARTVYVQRQTKWGFSALTYSWSWVKNKERYLTMCFLTQLKGTEKQDNSLCQQSRAKREEGYIASQNRLFTLLDIIDLILQCLS